MFVWSSGMENWYCSAVQAKTFMTKELQQYPFLTGGVMRKDELPVFNTSPNRELEEYKVSIMLSVFS